MSVTLDILEIGARGDGIAQEDGQRFFVPFTLPGETVEAEPGEKRGEGIAAQLVEVLAPSRHRVPAACRHFGVCGGCALQHWRLDAYAAWKTDLIARALERQGIPVPTFEPMVQGQPGERRRADFIVRGRLAGFHERASHRAFNVEQCAVLAPRLTALLPSLRGVLPGDVALDAIVNDTDSGPDLLLRPHRRVTLTLETNQKLVAFAQAADLARLSWGDRANPDPIVTRRAPRFGLRRSRLGRAAGRRFPSGEPARRASDARVGCRLARRGEEGGRSVCRHRRAHFGPGLPDHPV